MRRTSVLVVLALVLSTAIPAAMPAPASAHTCTLTADRPYTIYAAAGPMVYSRGDATCTQNGYLRLTLSLQHYSTTLGWYTWASRVVEDQGDKSHWGSVTYSGCHTGAWRLKLTVRAVSDTGHAHTHTINSLTHWSGC